MTTDISPLAAAGRLIIDSYGPGRFKISGVMHEGSILLSPDGVSAWAIEGPAGLGPDSLDPLRALQPPTEVVLLGCGAQMRLIHSTIRSAWKERGLAVDIMDTGAACRTYNVLVAEDRRVAAALIAV